jgi:hypothetical protein
MAYFEIDGSHMTAEEGGRKSLDTRAPMLNLVPSGAITLTGYSIAFPDFWKGTVYYQGRQTVTFPFSIEYHSCSSWIGLVGQEWGPAEASPNTLADIALGTVPAGTDYLEIWVNLTRTVSPANILDLALASLFPEGQWVKLDGYSCIIEEFGGVSRQFEFVLSGTTVYLRRYQSVNNDGINVSPPVQRATGSASSGSKFFFFPGTNAATSSDYALFGQKIDEKNSTNSPTHRPSGYEAGSSSNVPCDISHAGISYASTWTGDIIITPGCFSV